MENIVLNFLKNEFPIKRLKNGKRFGRGIIINYNNLEYRKFLSNKNDVDKLFIILYKILINIFDLSGLEGNSIVLKYLGII